MFRHLLILLAALSTLQGAKHKYKVNHSSLPTSVTVLSGSALGASSRFTGSVYLVGTDRLSWKHAIEAGATVRLVRPKAVLVQVPDDVHLYDEKQAGNEMRAAQDAVEQLTNGCVLTHADVPKAITEAKVKLAVPEAEVDWFNAMDEETKALFNDPDKIDDLLKLMDEHAPHLKRVWIDDRAVHITFKMQEALRSAPDQDVVAVVGLAHVKAVTDNWGKVDEDAYEYTRLVPRHKYDEGDLAKKWDDKKDAFERQIDEDLGRLSQDQIPCDHKKKEETEKTESDAVEAEEEEQQHAQRVKSEL